MSRKDVKRLQVKVIDALIQFQLGIHNFSVYESHDHDGKLNGYFVGKSVGADVGG
jgi:hypothetical protein